MAMVAICHSALSQPRPEPTYYQNPVPNLQLYDSNVLYGTNQTIQSPYQNSAKSNKSTSRFSNRNNVPSMPDITHYRQHSTDSLSFRNECESEYEPNNYPTPNDGNIQSKSVLS